MNGVSDSKAYKTIYKGAGMVRTAVHWWYGCIQLPQSVHRVLSKSWEHMVKNIPAIFNHFPGRKHIYYITLNKELQGV